MNRVVAAMVVCAGAYLAIAADDVNKAPVSTGQNLDKSPSDLLDEIQPQIVFVPGILGSKIYRCPKQRSHRNCEEVWGEDAIVDALLSERSAIYDSRYDYETEILDKFWIGDVYGGITNFIRGLSAKRNVLNIFSYDWRLSNSVNASAFEGFLCGLHEKHQRAKILIVAHSMGGLVVRHWLGGAKKACGVDKIVFVGTPHLGASKAVLALFKGGYEEVLGVHGVAKGISRALLSELNKAGPTFPSLYELFPIQVSESCWKRVEALKGLKFKYHTVGSAGNFDIFDAKTWDDFGLATTLRRDVTAQSVQELLAKGESISCGLAERPVSTLPNVDVVYVSGRQGSQNTIDTLTFAPGSGFATLNPGLKQDFGDGTVVVASSENLLGSSAKDIVEATGDHIAIVNDRRVRAIIDNWFQKSWPKPTGAQDDDVVSVRTSALGRSLDPEEILDTDRWDEKDFRQELKQERRELLLTREGQKLEEAWYLTAWHYVRRLVGWEQEPVSTLECAEDDPERKRLELDDVYHCIARMVDADFSEQSVISGLTRAARYHFAVGDYALALRAAQRALERMEKSSGSSSVLRYVTAQSVAGWAALRLDRRDIARRHFAVLEKSQLPIAQQIGKDGFDALQKAESGETYVESYDWEQSTFANIRHEEQIIIDRERDSGQRDPDAVVMDWQNWGLQDGGYQNQRYSKLNQINTENVDKLKVAWTFSTGLQKKSSAPLVVGGVLYIYASIIDTVYALDAGGEGGIVWKYKLDQDPELRSLDDETGHLAYWDGKIFLSQEDTTLVALDAKTGKELWKVLDGSPRKGERSGDLVLAARNKIIVRAVGTELGTGARITAYDAGNGGRLWRVSDSGSGCSGWYSYDPELNLLYCSQDNASTWLPATSEGKDTRPADAPAVSIIARNLDTGAAAWLFEMTPFDEWDNPGAETTTLADIYVDGEKRKVLVQLGETGSNVVVDRASGELLVIDGATGVRQQSRPYCHAELPAAFSPQTGLFYIAARRDCPKGNGKTPGQFASNDTELIAWDGGSGEVSWGTKDSGATSPLATAGGVVFYGSIDGLKAVDQRNGKLLFSSKAAAGQVENIVTYMDRGKQYVGVYSGVGWAGGLGTAPEVPGSADEDRHGPSPDNQPKARNDTAAGGGYTGLQEYTRLGGSLTVFALP